MSDANGLGSNSSPTEFHNEAMDVRRTQGKEAAMEVLREGLLYYPYDVDLLSDAIAYAPTGSPEQWDDGTAREPEFAEDYLRLLFQREKMWTWRAYDFSIDYLLDRKISVLREDEDVRSVKEMAIDIAVLFTKRFPGNERSWGAYVKALVANGQDEDAKKILEAQIDPDNPTGKQRPMGQCCLVYADMLMEEGDYEKVIKVCGIGVKHLAQPQPHARTGYLLLLEALSRDALMYGEYLEDTNGNLGSTYGDQERVKRLFDLYATADRLLGKNGLHSTIVERATILSYLSGHDIPEELKGMEKSDENDLMVKFLMQEAAKRQAGQQGSN